MTPNQPIAHPAAPRPIKMWVRALAWIIVICAVPAYGWAIYSFIQKPHWPDAQHVLQVVASIWVMPLFAYVAFKGSTPRSWLGIGSVLNKDGSTNIDALFKKIPTAASIASLAISLTLSALCLFGWWSTGHLHQLLAGLGFAILSPVWYASPIRWRSFFESNGRRVTYPHRFRPWEGLASLIGSVCLVAALLLWLVRLTGLLRT